jgi:hypothetical protein
VIEHFTATASSTVTVTIQFVTVKDNGGGYRHEPAHPNRAARRSAVR